AVRAIHLPVTPSVSVRRCENWPGRRKTKSRVCRSKESGARSQNGACVAVQQAANLFQRGEKFISLAISKGHAQESGSIPQTAVPPLGHGDSVRVGAPRRNWRCSFGNRLIPRGAACSPQGQ